MAWRVFCLRYSGCHSCVMSADTKNQGFETTPNCCDWGSGTPCLRRRFQSFSAGPMQSLSPPLNPVLAPGMLLRRHGFLHPRAGSWCRTRPCVRVPKTSNCKRLRAASTREASFCTKCAFCPNFLGRGTCWVSLPATSLGLPRTL